MRFEGVILKIPVLNSNNVNVKSGKQRKLLFLVCFMLYITYICCLF